MHQRCINAASLASGYTRQPDRLVSLVASLPMHHRLSTSCILISCIHGIVAAAVLIGRQWLMQPLNCYGIHSMNAAMYMPVNSWAINIDQFKLIWIRVCQWRMPSRLSCQCKLLLLALFSHSHLIIICHSKVAQQDSLSVPSASKPLKRCRGYSISLHGAHLLSGCKRFFAWHPVIIRCNHSEHNYVSEFSLEFCWILLLRYGFAAGIPYREHFE